jgi:hypothetical protein
MERRPFVSSQSVTYATLFVCLMQSAWSLPRGGGGGMTLATLIGLVDAMESRCRPRTASRSGKLRALLLSLCLRSHLENGRSAPSLRQFLEMERRAGGAGGHVHGL